MLTVADGPKDINVRVATSSMVRVLQKLPREKMYEQVMAELMQNVVDWTIGLFWDDTHPDPNSRTGFRAYLDPAGLFLSSITVTTTVEQHRITVFNKATQKVLFEALIIPPDGRICIIQMGIGQLDVTATLSMTGSDKGDSPAPYGGTHGHGEKQVIAFVSQDPKSWMELRGTIDAKEQDAWRASCWVTSLRKGVAHVDGRQLENTQDVVPSDIRECMSHVAREELAQNHHLCHILSFGDADESSVECLFDALCRSTLVFRANSDTVRLTHPSHPATALIPPDRLGRCNFINGVPTLHGPDFGYSVVMTGVVKAFTNSDRGEHQDSEFCPVQQQTCDMIVDICRDADPISIELLLPYLKVHHDAFEGAAGPAGDATIHEMKRFVCQCSEAQCHISKIKFCCFEHDCDHAALQRHDLLVVPCPEVPRWFRWAMLQGTGSQDPCWDAPPPLFPIATEYTQSCDDRISKHLLTNPPLIPLSEYEANRDVTTRLNRLCAVLVFLGTRLGCMSLAQTTIILLNTPTESYRPACVRVGSTVRIYIDHLEDEDLIASVAQYVLTEITGWARPVALAVYRLWVDRFDLDASQSTDPEQIWLDYGASLCILCGYAVPAELSTSPPTVAWTSACWQQAVSLLLSLS